ncbi:MAG: 2-octaprenyl-6-methoxyphenyl hydroxylase [gamma proteobacterium symbiont of Phacoides pectinatus]
MKSEFDLVIVGGGMVGASLVRALVGRGLSVALVEAWPLDSEAQPSYDDRAIALSQGTRVILESIGVWERLAGDVEPIRRIHVSDRGQFGFARLDCRDHDLEALGYVATGHALGQALLRGVGDLPGVTLLCPARLDSFELDDQAARLTLSLDEGERRISAPLLVAADGARSMVRAALGIEAREWGYGQTAIISNLTSGTPSPGVAYERFTDAGPMAMLPLSGGRYALVWTVADAEVEEVMALDDTQILARVQGRFGNRLGRFQRAGRRSSYPLKLLLAREQVRSRLALIGNAAHAVHPITGQGFNLGIRDVAVLAEVLGDARAAGADIGALETLRAYADWRQRDQQGVALMTDGLVRLFTNPLPPVRLARNLGLLALDLAPPLKQLLSRQFMGLNGRLPRLARGVGLE